MNLKETISTVLNEEENRVFPDMFGYRFYFYFGEGYSERPHIHFYGDGIPISKGSKKDNQGAISLEKKGYEPHGEAIGILDKKHLNMFANNYLIIINLNIFVKDGIMKQIV